MADDLKSHLEAIRGWLECRTDLPTPQPGLSAEERKQLNAVNKTIQQLTALNVSIPDDLRKLKLNLSAKDHSRPVNSLLEERLIEVEGLIEHLRELTQAARTLRNRLKNNGQNPGTKKHYGVSLKELIESGHLSTDDELELQWLKGGPTFEGKVRDDGTVMAKTEKGWSPFDSLSTAASTIGQRALNGWDHWRRVNKDGSRTVVSEIRAQFLNEKRGLNA